MEYIYAIQCDLFPKTKIIEILKHNRYYFFPVSPKPEEGFGEYISFSEDKMWFVKKALILSCGDFKIIIGNTYREDTNDSAFQIYFPNQTITAGFNYNAEFSKALTALDGFDLNSSSPIIAINLYKKNLDKLINENDITYANVQTKLSKKFRPVKFEEAKRNGVEKLFLYRQKDSFIVIGWILQGRRNKNTVIYNKAFTEFLTGIESIDLKIPEGLDLKRSYEKDSLSKGKRCKENGDLGLSHNPKSILQDKSLILNFKGKGKLWTDHTPNIEQINIILEKINRSGLESLSVEEMIFLKNNSDGV